MIIESYRELFLVILQTVCIFIVYFLLYRRYIYSLFDPLFFYLITQAFSVELAILKIEDINYLLNFLSCQFLFTIGFIYINRPISTIKSLNNDKYYFSKKELWLLKSFTIWGIFLVISVNSYFFIKKGIILFSEDPSLSKATEFENGFGFVKRINLSMLNLLSLISLFLYVYLGKKVYVLYIIILILISISGGNKSSLLTYLYIISLLGLFKTFKKINYFKDIKRLSIPLGFVAITIALYIFSIRSESFEETIFAAGIRFLYFGDIILYYYTPETVQYFQQLGLVDFFNYEFNGILGLFRIVDYMRPLGSVMVLYSLSDEQYLEFLDLVVGPNAPFYVKGHIFFGGWGALIYSLLVGMIVGFFRQQLFKINETKIRYSFVLLILFINIQIFNLPQDSGLLISTFFDTMFFSIILIIPCFLQGFSIKIKKRSQ